MTALHLLKFSLYKGVIDQRPFDILQRKTLQLGEGERVSLKVIGESHLIEHTIGNMTITEVLACSNKGDVNVKNKGLLVDSFFLFGEKEKEKEYHIGTIQYKFNFSVIEDTQKISEEYIEIAKHPKYVSLLHLFNKDDQNPSHYNSSPLTLILYDKMHREVQTIHTYPEEKKVVLSKTTITI